MSKNLLFSVLVLFSLVLITACEPEFIPASTAEAEMDFVPIDSLTTWEYRMDSIIFDNEGLTIDTFVSYRQEHLAGEFMDSEGKIVHRLIISKKVDWNDIYKETDLWTAQINENGFQRKEENLNFVKLIFPVVLGETWDGNQFPDTTKVYIAGEELEMYTNWKYAYDSRIDSFSVRGELFNDVLRVFQADNTNAINRRYSVEYYAKGVGLIQRNMEILHTQCTEPGCENIPWQQKAEKGFVLKQELINYY